MLHRIGDDKLVDRLRLAEAETRGGFGVLHGVARGVQLERADIAVVAKKAVVGQIALDRASLLDARIDQLDVRVLVLDRSRNLFEQHRLAGFRLSNYKTSLSSADRRYQIHDPRRKVDARVLEHDFLVCENRGEAVKMRPSLCSHRIESIDRLHIQKRPEFLSAPRLSRDAEYLVARPEPKPSDLGRRDVYVLV